MLLESSDESDYGSDEEINSNSDTEQDISSHSSSGIGEDEGNDIFQDAKEYLELQGVGFEGLEDALEFLDKDNIFKDPPGLMGVPEYQIAVAKFIANGISWEDTASVLFQVDRHSQIEMSVRQLYFSALAEEVGQQISEVITSLCCSRNRRFFDCLEHEKPEINSKLWEKALELEEHSEGNKIDPVYLKLFRKQLQNFKNVENGKKDKTLQKLWKKTVFRWMQLINTLAPHFFDNSVERELLSCLFNWFTCGEMSHSQFKNWKKLFKAGDTTDLKKLKRVSWEDGNHAKEHVSLFQSLLDDVPTKELTKIDDFNQLLGPFLSKPTFELVDGKSKLKISGKGLFLSDIVTEILKHKADSVKEVNIYAKYFVGIDCSLENNHWHGINFTILTDKLTIWKASVIDVSGIGYSRDVRAPANNGSYSGQNGDDGVDGKAGESGGNVVIMANQLKNSELLTIKLNGGTGEGGQNGGAGADGRKGISITKTDFLNTILKYDSLYRDFWSKFSDYHPGSDWTKDEGTSVNKTYEKWIYRTYTHNDGRKMIYSFAGDCGWTYNTYDIMFLIEGTDGSMGGSGGKNGVSGEGGNAGDFKAWSFTGTEIKNIGKVEMKKGEDGKDGRPGLPGNPGVNGNHMAMTDRSSGSWSYSARESRYIHGGAEGDRLQIAYQYSANSYNALNGKRRHQENCSDYYTSFNSESIPTISHTKETKKKTSSERTTRSQAVSKQTISVQNLLEEFAEICEGDELNIGDISDFKELETEQDEEEEKEEKVQEEISVVRTLVEDSQEHEKNLRRALVKPNEVIKEIHQAVSKLEKLNLVELIELWKRIFTVPLSVDEMESDLLELFNLLCDVKFIEESFKNCHTIDNGMSRRDVEYFVDNVKTNFTAKRELSSLEMTLDLNASGPSSLELKDSELTDVYLTHLDEFWMEVNTEEYKNRLTQPLFNQVRDNNLHSVEILMALNKINTYLQDKEEAFKPFYRDSSFNWADIPAVQNFLQSFLTEEEKKKIADKEEKEKKEAEEKKIKEEKKLKKEAEEKKKKEEKKFKKEGKKTAKKQVNADAKKAKEAFSEITSQEHTTSEESDQEKSAEPEVLSEAKEDKIFAEKETTNWFLGLWKSKEVSQAFKKVAEQFKDEEEKTKDSVFSSLISLLKQDRRLAERFCMEKTTVRNELKPPGSSPQSLVHIYYLTKQILNYNVKLFRYYLPFENEITIPNDWYDPSKEIPLNSITDLILWTAGRELPIINSNMQYFIQRNGIRCRSYRQMVADQCKVNIQMFCESGYCKMRLVENLNPECKEVRRLVIKDGELKTIAVNETLRRLRSVMNTCKLNISLPQSHGHLQLASYFPDSFEPKIQEWTEAAIAATSSEMLPRFFHRLFELRGNSMSVVDLQFAVNTFIEASRTFDVPLEALCNRILTKDGGLLEIFLALRVMGIMKGAAPKLDYLVQQLSEIKDSRLKALFGSKLHEIPITDAVLTKLVKMLAHADDRVSQLEKMHLQEWVDIANCQRWNSYAPLLKAYGTVGYYIVLLDTIGREEGQRLQRIIQNMKMNNKTCIILEKIISSFTFLISNNELIFDQKYEEALSRLLQLISQKCVEMDAEEIHKELPKLELRKEDVGVEAEGSYIKTENIYLITNEVQQHIIFSLISPSLQSEIEAVLPEDNRSLTDLIRLSINPQDTDDQKLIRKQDMQTIEKILSNHETEDIYGNKLQEIDDKLHKIYGKRLRNTQKIAILSAAKSDKNLLSQVNTGEGKSFIISCLAILRILVDPEDTVDIITSSSVLAQRDAESMRKLYEAFDIEVGHNCDEDVEKRKLAYKCGVVYGEISRFERDYLLQTFYKKNILGSRSRCNVIVDEVDSMLLDNGSNMLYLSHNVPGLELLDSFFVYLHKLVNTPSINENEANFSSKSLRQKVLADMYGLVTKEDVKELLFDKNNSSSIGKVWRILATQNVIDSEGILKQNWDYVRLAKELQEDCGKTLAGRVFAMLTIIKNRRQEIGIPSYLKFFVLTHLDEFIKNSKQALFLKHNDEYVVDLDRTGRVADLHPVITIIDKGTGTDLSTSQWSEGLHQFLQLKHGCRLTPLSLKAVFISNVSYLREYKRLNGFSGTLGSVEESKSLVELYNADMLKIPTWKPKKFNENAPILATTKEDWINEIFAEVCDQVIASRSVLVICQSIAKVEELNNEFKKLYREMISPSKKITEAFENMTVYTREFDDVDFSAEEKLPCCRIIISTNLAGRGTDIVLSDDLINKGGLHVIVSFLPENSRIENQAYGRAARCGQQGSGQIICLVQEEDNGANNIFQLKQFRDNAEVHRLRSLKQFYDYHIAVEETCLKLFKDHCNLAMESVHSASEELTITQVVYFALLDEWAAWLDSKAEEIKQCEKDKNDVLKDHIIGSVKKFLDEHPLPTSEEDYSTNLVWINCPQPLLSIALIHMQDKKVEDAVKVLDQVINKFPDFEAEAYYYKGVIEQWEIRQALEIQPPAEKDDDGKVVPGKLGIRHKAMNWLLKNLIFSDDCPDSLIKKCNEKIHSSTEYFLLSRSLFSTRIRKKNDMTHIVKILMQKSAAVTSRGFATQQEEAIAILECFIGSIDDILGHRAKPEDVKIGDEAPHLTIRRYREIVKRANIITPSQLSNRISDQQMNMLANNHYLPLAVLHDGFQKTQDDEHLEEYDGQKIIGVKNIAANFSLPSVHGFWESLRRAGCFLSEQFFIAVKKSDKDKVPVLKDIAPIHVKLNKLQLQFSTENLAEYDLYDVHGSAAAIKQNDEKNAELHEAQEAGLVRIEVVATINTIALALCSHLDQFSYLTVNEVAAELTISTVEAEWIMETLVSHGVVVKRTAEIEYPPTPEEIDAMNREIQEKQQRMKEQNEMKQNGEKTTVNDTPENGESSKQNGEKKLQNGDKEPQSDNKNEASKDNSSSAMDSRAEDETNTKTEPKQTCIAYFPMARISCDMFPSNMRSSIQLMLTRNFSYHSALMSLKTSIMKALDGEEVLHKICLPTEPYVDLYRDLEVLGIVQHSRVTSILTEIYKPKEDSGIVKFGKEIFGLKTVTHYISPIIYKRLEPKLPKLCTRVASLVNTSAYLDEKSVPASAEIRKTVSNGLRKVAVIHEKNWWKWALGIFLIVVAVVVLPLMLIASAVAIFCPVILPYILIALVVVAAVGTMLYCMSLLSENQKIASTLNLGLEEEFHMLRTYHEGALDAPKRAKLNEAQRKHMEKTVTHFIQILISAIELTTQVTSSDEDISLCIDALEHCAQNSTHLPLLKQSLELWFKTSVRNIQEFQFDAVFNRTREVNLSNKLPKLPPTLLLPYAFSSMLISEVNSRKKNRESKKAISTKLDFGSFPVDAKYLTEPKEDSCPLSFALSKVLKNLLAPMIEENIATIIDPALNGIDAAWRKSREDKTITIEQNDETMKKKQIQHSAERLAREQTVDFLATDLHNVFQRIAFREVSKPMLQHMINFNYPLNPHCAKDIFDATVTILQSVDKVLKQVDIELKRNDKTIYIYNGLKEGCRKKDSAPLIIGLESDSFYILELKDLVKNHEKYRHGLFQALCEYSTKFCDNFALDPQSFVDKLYETVATGLDTRWISSASWNKNEKLKCAVAIW